MPKKEYNKNPQNLNVAKNVIKGMNSDIQTLEGQITKAEATIVEKDQKIQEITTELNIEKERTRQNNAPLTEAEIIAQAKELGMKTQEEYQQALVKDTSDSKPEGYSQLWWLLLIPVLLLGWGVIKGKFKAT